MPGLDSQLAIRSSPETNTTSSALAPTVVPELESECFLHREQWQYVIGPISSPRISYRTRPQAGEPFSDRISPAELPYNRYVDKQLTANRQRSSSARHQNFAKVGPGYGCSASLSGWAAPVGDDGSRRNRTADGGLLASAWKSVS
jgi:hypothetical protein